MFSCNANAQTCRIQLNMLKVLKWKGGMNSEGIVSYKNELCTTALRFVTISIQRYLENKANCCKRTPEMLLFSIQTNLECMIVKIFLWPTWWYNFIINANKLLFVESHKLT